MRSSDRFKTDVYNTRYVLTDKEDTALDVGR
jgi:hypothetical protein